MWIGIVIALVAVFLVLSVRLRPQIALGIVVAVSCAFPAWLMWPLFDGPPNSVVGQGPDIKFAVGVICLVLYCFLPGRTFPVRLVPSDIAALGIITVHLISDFSQEGFRWMIPVRAYAEWYLPYVAGRVAFDRSENIEKIWPAVVCVGISLSGLAIIEAAFSLNLFESVFGERPIEGFPRNASRWGYHRAYGPTLHPIYFGVMQLLLLGWAGFAASRAYVGKAHRLWLLAPLPILAGIIATGSRGPILGILIAGLAGCFYRFKKTRLLIGGLAIMAGVLAVGFQENLLQQFERWSGERTEEISVDGETIAQSSIRNRLNLIKVYQVALKRAGLLGFGSEAVAGFPINVPVGPNEAATLRSVRNIDNTYVLVLLRFGYLGSLLFLLIIALGALQFFMVSNKGQRRITRMLATSLGSVSCACGCLLLTVWMPYEIGFPLLWTLGISAGLTVAWLESGKRPRHRASSSISRDRRSSSRIKPRGHTARGSK